MDFIICIDCQTITERINNVHKRCKPCAEIERKKKNKGYLKRFYEKNPNYHKNKMNEYREGDL